MVTKATIGRLNYQIGMDTTELRTDSKLSRSEIGQTKRLMKESRSDTEAYAEKIGLLERAYQTGTVEAKDYRATLDGLQSQNPEVIAATKRKAAAERQAAEEMRQSEQITRRLMTAEERHSQTVRKLNGLKSKARINEETYKRALAESRSTLPSVIAAETRRADSLRRSEQLQRQLENSTERYTRELRELTHAYNAGEISQELFRRGQKRLQTQQAVGITRGQVTGAIGGTLAAGYAFARVARRNEEFQQAMYKSLAIAGDVSDGLRDKLTASAQQIAFHTKFSAAEAAGSIEFLQLAGLDLNKTLAAMPQTALFAQAGMFDIARATDLATDAQSAMGLDAKDTTQHIGNMARVTDVLTAASTLSNASIEQFASAITNGAGPAARLVKKDIEETTAVIAAFAKTGFAKGEEAGTQYGIVLRDLQTKAIKKKKAFKEAGIAVFDAGGKMNRVSDIVRQLEARFGSMSDEASKAGLLQLGFSDKSVKSVQALFGLSDAIDDYEAKLRNAGGTTQEVADKQLPPLTQALQRLQATWDTFSEVNVSPMIEGLAGVNGQTNQLAQGLAIVANTADRIQKVWALAQFGVEATVFGIQSVISTLMDGIVSVQSGTISLLDTVNSTSVGDALIPDSAIAKAKELHEQMKLAAMAVDTEGSYIELQKSHQQLNKTLEEPLAGDAFLTRMKEVSRELESAKASFNSPNAARGAQDPLQQLLAAGRDETPAEVKRRKHMEKLEKQGEQLADRFMEPAEAFRKRIEELKELQALGFIDQKTFAAAKADAAERANRKKPKPEERPKPTAPSGAERGSAEAYKLITDILRADRDDKAVEKKIEENTGDMVDELKGLNAQLANFEQLEGVGR